MNDFPSTDGGLLATEAPGDNAAPFSVSELAMRLKRTVEDAFGLGHLRLAGDRRVKPLDAAFRRSPRLR